MMVPLTEEKDGGKGPHAFCSHNEQSINVSGVPATCMDGGIEDGEGLGNLANVLKKQSL